MRRLGLLALGLGGAVCLTWCGDDSGSIFDGGNTDAKGGGNDATVDNNSGDGACTGPFCGIDAGDTSTGSCTNLCLKQVTCPPATDGAAITTTVSGTVYDPADQVPLYNVVVYVPNAPLSPITHGATCDTCSSNLSGSPLVSTLTDYTGHFVLQNVPVTSSLPLVFQVGKWRRHITVPVTITACVDNPLTDKTLTRLPTKPAENNPDDDIPYIALTTGGADALECLPMKIGIDVGQFNNGTSGGRVDLYQGNGGAGMSGGLTSATSFWADNGSPGTHPLNNYDMVMLGCEGGTYPNEKPLSALQAMQSYANVGGRVFGTHYHYYWIESSPAPWPGTATWNHAQQPNNQTNWPVLIDMTFPKGLAFADWMLANGGSSTLGTFNVAEARHDVDAVNGNPTTDPESIRWVYSNPTMPSSGNPALVEYYSFNTPVFEGGVPDGGVQCGKVVFSDLHVASGNNPGGTFPGNCVQTGGLTAQEKALEFLLFDLSSCVQNDSLPPPPPPVN